MAGRDQVTRQRVLEAAAHLFAIRGFKKVTVRAICAAAHANVASVNYHFRDKLGLYREVLAMAIATMQQTTEDAKRAGCRRRPSEKLRAFVDVYVKRLLGDGNTDTWLHRLMARELSDPTPALDAIVDRALRPRMDYLCVIVGEIIDRPPSDERVRSCAASIQAQCLMALPNPITGRLGIPCAWTTGVNTSADIDRLADHIATFSLGGVRAIGRIS